MGTENSKANSQTSKTEKTIKIDGVDFIKSFAGVDEYRLANGFKILLKPNYNVPLISSQVWYKVGSRNEVLGLTGIAHYLEHIMFKGTETFKKGEIAQAIQLRGGVFNAFTSDDYTAYFENFSPENLELAIKIESDRMLHSRLNHEEVELERSVIVSELEGRKNNPTNILYEALKANAYQLHSYKNPVIGWREDLENINAKNMREFYETYYKPNNAIAVLVGNFDTKLALELINKYFGGYNTPKQDLVATHDIPKEPEQHALKKITIKNGGVTKQLAIAFHVPELNHEDSPSLSLIADIIFNGMSSRLYPKLVDSGLAIDISGAPEFGIDPGIFRIIVTLNPDGNIEKVEEIIDAELENIKSIIKDEELKIAKAKEEAAFIYQADGVYEEGLQIGYYSVVAHDWTKFATWLDEINKVSAEDIKTVAKKYFKPSNKTIVYLLPEEQNDSLTGKTTKKVIASASDITVSSEPDLVAGYGANAVEPLDPKKLDRLLKITGANYSKGHKFAKLDLQFSKLSVANEGLQIYFREDHNLPLVFLNATVYAGSVADKSKPGIAYITSEMLERGSKSKDKYEISKLMDLYGSEISIDAGIETGRISLSSITKNLDASADILSEILRQPAFDAKELERLKTETIGKLKQEEDNSGRIANREISRIIYPKGHPYYLLTIDERIKAIKSITIDDVKKFYKDNYNAKNLLISVVGDIDEANAVALIDKVFTGWNLAKGESLDKVAGNNYPVIANVDIKEPEEKVVTKNDKKQSEIILAHSSPIDRSHPDFYALLIANYALGGSSLSSRLGTAVRDENGYVYNVRSNFQSSLGAGIFSVILGCNPKNVTKAETLSKEVIEKFLKEGISETELSVTKSYLTGSFAARNLASNNDIVETLSQIQLYKLGDDYVKTYADMINAITLEQVNTAARKYIHPDKLSTVIVGPEYK